MSAPARQRFAWLAWAVVLVASLTAVYALNQRATAAVAADDEGGDTRGEERSGPAVGAPAATTASGAGVTVDPATPKTATRPSRNLQVALAADELRPGPGFELTSDRPPGPAREGGGGSARWLAYSTGLAAVSAGAVAFVRRRRQWSPTQV